MRAVRSVKEDEASAPSILYKRREFQWQKQTPNDEQCSSSAISNFCRFLKRNWARGAFYPRKAKQLLSPAALGLLGPDDAVWDRQICLAQRISTRYRHLTSPDRLWNGGALEAASALSSRRVSGWPESARSHVVLF
jgi:hypothetical protein